MSDERWIKMTTEQRVNIMWDPLFDLADAFDAAEGQRVETIRWCITHGERAGRVRDDRCRHVGGCVVVDATLILPPEAAS
jgi:divalent metal cation (Fe/Co/Zn/Cd) transporter